MAEIKKTRYERRQQARERRLQQSRQARWRNLRRSLLLASGVLAVAVLVVGGLFLFAGTIKVLPPKNLSINHAEAYPPQQINTVPIPLSIQGHLPERGGGHHLIGTMSVQYNCVDYECEAKLIQKLVEVVREYPSNVFLAPYPGMDAKIALTAPGRQEVLEAFDGQRIRQFLTNNLFR